MSLKFGDIIDNGYASDSNPIKYGIVVNATSKQIKVTDGKGKFWIVDNHDRIKMIGSVYLTTVQALADAKGLSIEDRQLLKEMRENTHTEGRE